MRVLIVDDEAPARRRMVRLLSNVPGLTVVGEAADGATALRQVQLLAPQALFLDVQMPRIDGFQVAASLPDPSPAIVYVTAHAQHAVAAFDVGALDYVLKPVEPARLMRAVERLRERLMTPQRPALATPPAQLLVSD
jgi:two-component system LytT family response regulator